MLIGEVSEARAKVTEPQNIHDIEGILKLVETLYTNEKDNKSGDATRGSDHIYQIRICDELGTDRASPERKSDWAEIDKTFRNIREGSRCCQFCKSTQQSLLFHCGEHVKQSPRRTSATSMVKQILTLYG
jgi:hypothetical protein